MQQTPDNPAGPVSPGERLKQAREQAGLSVEKVAKDLYLDTQIIRAIEINSFKDLGAPVYAKGYIRKYARMVGLTEEDVLAQYQQSANALPPPALIPLAMGTVPEARQPLPRWVLWVVVALLVLAGVVTLQTLRTDDSSGPVPQQDTVVSPLLGESGADLTPLADGSVSLPVVTDAASAPGSVALHFSFTGDSWIEVYDAQGQQVVYEMGVANGVREIAAVPPLRVTLGAARVVRLSVNGQAIEVPATAVQAGVAKFVIKPDGSLE